MGAMLSWVGTFLAGLLRGMARDWRAREAIRDQGRAETEDGFRDADDDMRRRAADAAAADANDLRDPDERLRGHSALRDD